MEYIILDLEWNQVYSKQNAAGAPIKSCGEVIQIGAVKLNEHYEQTDTFQILIRPVFIRKLHRGVAKITRLTDAILAEEGYSFPEAFALFLHWCGGDFRLFTWGTDDIPVFRVNMQTYGISPDILPRWYDLQLIYDWQIGKQGRQCSLADAVETLGAEKFDAHDALNDARMTAQVFTRLNIEEAVGQYSARLAERSRLQHKKRNARQKERKKRKKLAAAQALQETGLVHTVRIPGSYMSKGEIIRSVAAAKFFVPELGITIRTEGWTPDFQNKYISRGIAENGSEYLLKLKLKPDKSGAGKWRATVTVRAADTGNADAEE